MAADAEAVAFARSYKVVNHRIVDPGKYEGEAPYVPYFDYFAGNGDGEFVDDDDSLLEFEVRPEDKAEFPELRGMDKVTLWYRNDGFVQEL